MNTQLQIDAEKFSDFLVKNYPRAREWEDPVGYCAWYISKGYIATVADGDEIVALCAIRPVDKPGFGVLPFYCNESGKSLHIDLLIDRTDDQRAITLFRDLFTFRFGPRETVAMFRHGENSTADTAIRIYDYRKFWNNVARIKKVTAKKRSYTNGIIR